MFKGSSFGRQIAKFAAGSALSQIIVAASIPIVARLYDPTILGNFFFFDAFCDVFAFGSTLALDKAIYVTRSEKGVRALIAATMISVTLVSLLAGSILAGAIALGLTTDGLSSYWLILPCIIVVWARGAYYLFQSLSIRSSQFGQIVLAENLRATAILTGRIGFGLIHFSLTGLLITAAASALIATSVISRRNLQLTRQSLQPLYTKQVWRTLYRHRQRIFFEGSGQFLRQLPMRAPVFAIAVYFMAAGAGLYSIALLLTYRPTELIVRSVSEVFRTKIAENLRTGDLRAANQLSKTLIKRTMVAAPLGSIAAGAFVWGTEGILFPENWIGVGSVAFYNSLYVAGLMLIRPVQIIFSLYKRQGLTLLIEFSAVAACFGGIFIGGSLGYSLDMVCLISGILLMLALIPLTMKSLEVVRV